MITSFQVWASILVLLILCTSIGQPIDKPDDIDYVPTVISYTFAQRHSESSIRQAA